MKRVDEISLSDYRKRSFLWKWSFQMINNVLDIHIHSKLLPNKNPLKWCLMDLIKCMYLFVTCLFVTVLLPVLSAFDANLYYANFDDSCSVHDVIIPW